MQSEGTQSLKALANPLQLCITLNQKWLQAYGAGSMSGNCGKLASLLRDAMQKRGYKGYVASGYVEGTIGNHAWVVWEGQILDPSVNQFGDHEVTNNALRYIEQRRMEFLK